MLSSTRLMIGSIYSFILYKRFYISIIQAYDENSLKVPGSPVPALTGT
jgi:hypothetical protein